MVINGYMNFQQLLETQTCTSIFKDNVMLANEITDNVVQHFVRAIETNGRHVQYIKFLQTVVKAENQYIRKTQDMVMAEVGISFYVCIGAEFSLS